MGHKSPLMQMQVDGAVLCFGHRELRQFLVSVRHCRDRNQPLNKPAWWRCYQNMGLLWMCGSCSPPCSLVPALSNPVIGQKKERA